ncbi:Voltage-dependent calcium channel subunit alpha-2/delta-3, partial [Pseudolycoriella hygida]
MFTKRRNSFIDNPHVILAACILCYGFLQTAETSKEAEIVSSWAQEFGDELWQLGQKMTKSNEIKMKYKKYNARVEQKTNDTLINSIVDNVGRMLQRKIDAVRCILNKAEDTAETFEFNNDIYKENKNFSYFSSKYSPKNNVNISEELGERLPEIIKQNMSFYEQMLLDRDTHFYNISVNTTHSSVHVPTNIYDRSPDVLETLIWSEALDQVFVKNYQSDPALSWQYFGSDTGIMRHFPAKRWEYHDVDVYDCRKRSWYIETATCSKDMVILLDNSGSMYGFRNFIAQLTIKSILDSLSNNDFINILLYSKEVTNLVPCFNNTLVQATPENIAVFNEKVKELKPEGFANVDKAYIEAFKLLQKYQVTNVREIQWMACLNRGYYSHVQTLDEVQGEVLKYVTVIATPLVLQGKEHPPTWTHAFKDYFSDDDDNDENDDSKPDSKPARLMIAVGVPAFDKKMNNQNGTRKNARLLGVASTDVPVEDINKLTLPYKLGVNGYSFIVSNNGYVLLHPDLRPVEQKQLKPNYNSIDLTEVEQFDDLNPAREPGEQLLKLREQLVNRKEGKMLNVAVKFHYDKMRRISQENYDYHFKPLNNTPFSLGLAIPSGYGKTWIKVGDEVGKNLRLGINMSNFFVGENFKVHPQWVYCKYHYLEGHEFDTPEMELKHFLKKLSDPLWKWSEQYEIEPTYQVDGAPDQPDCDGKTLGDDAYYCNKELMELLIFDAKVTNASYSTWNESKSDKQLIDRFNATLRFVATNSGLTRWQYINGKNETDTEKEFGDFHRYAIDETWYKAAILQHNVDPLSFVYSVPHVGEAENEDDQLKVTASHAIFPRDGGLEAPGLVVGFQFSHSFMYDRFMEITSKVDCDGCLRSCKDDRQDCYVIDNNGYIVLSERENDTGKFFGEVEGAVMESMTEDLEIFKVITVYDLQGLCSNTTDPNKTSEGDMLWNPFKLMLYTFKWILTELVIQWSKLRLLAEGASYETSYDDFENDYTSDGAKIMQKRTLNMEDEAAQSPQKEYETVYYACDEESHLYILQQDLFLRGGNELPSQGKSLRSRPYFFKRIPYSNLLLVVVNAEHQTHYVIKQSSPRKVQYNNTNGEQIDFPCYKLNLNDLPRRRIEECFTEHTDEANHIILYVATTILYVELLKIFQHFENKTAQGPKR